MCKFHFCGGLAGGNNSSHLLDLLTTCCYTRWLTSHNLHVLRLLCAWYSRPHLYNSLMCLAIGFYFSFFSLSFSNAVGQNEINGFIRPSLSLSFLFLSWQVLHCYLSIFVYLTLFIVFLDCLMFVTVCLTLLSFCISYFCICLYTLMEVCCTVQVLSISFLSLPVCCLWRLRMSCGETILCLHVITSGAWKEISFPLSRGGIYGWPAWTQVFLVWCVCGWLQQRWTVLLDNACLFVVFVQSWSRSSTTATPHPLAFHTHTPSCYTVKNKLDCHVFF